MRTSMSLKRKSLAGFVILIAAGIFSAICSIVVPAPWKELAAAIPFILALLVFLGAGRITCPNCNARVTGPGMNPAPLLLLWLARESCSKCHKPLEW
jgi:energy-coupling factor transporter transmembrane protein EcfT